MRRLALVGIVAALLLGWALIVMLSARAVSFVRNDEIPKAGDEIAVLTWNLGYGGLGAESDFVADGGTHFFPPSPQAVSRNIAGIIDTVKSIEADVYVFPETAKPSALNYWHDLLGALRKIMPNTTRVFSADILTRYLPWPLRFEHGMAMYSRRAVGTLNVEPLTREPDKIAGFISRDYTVRIIRVQVEGKPDWVILGVHLAAFDKNAEIRRKQLAEVMRYATMLHERGSPVIVAGDFNLVLSQTRFKTTTEPKYLGWIHNFPMDALPAGWRIGADPRISSVRTNERPYKAGENYTTVIDGFIVSPDVEIEGVTTRDLGFAFSDHQPVLLKARRRYSVPVSRSEDRGP
ncbi:MAG: endonuclease/exonuclease/phosphatase family protein [Pseudomonadota bacterium]